MFFRDFVYMLDVYMECVTHVLDFPHDIGSVARCIGHDFAIIML